MAIYLTLISLLSLSSFSLQSSQCQQKYVEEADGRYKFVVDCSNLGLDSFPYEVSELATVLYLNGNRLKSIDTKAMEKLVYLEVLDLSANDITSLPQGIFDNNKKLKTLDLGRNRLHCDWRIWWLVNFTKTLQSFNGHCFSPKSLRGRDIRKLTEKDVIVDCASKRMLNNQSKDGHYMFHVAGSGGKNIKLLIYCNNMGTETPKEYLTLPSGPGGNFIRGDDKSGKHCLGRNETSEHFSRAVIGFKKVRVLLRSLTIILDDLTFSSAQHKALFGSGLICTMLNATICIGADAMMDLRGTPFKIKESVKWQLPKDTPNVSITRQFSGAVTKVNCSSSCDGCSLTTPISLEPMDSQLMPYEACTRPLGIQDGRIPSRNITASSYLDHNFLPSHAKLFNVDHGGWCALKQDKNQFIQVDLGSVHTISGISTQGYETYADWVTSYKIFYKDENHIWKDYSIFGKSRVFPGNSDSTSVVTHWLDPRFRSRVVRIKPQTWYNGGQLDHRVCLRFELYGCRNDISSYIIKLGDNKPCISPRNNFENVTSGAELTFSADCSGTDFLFRFNEQNSLFHSMSGLCLSANENSTAILSSNCLENSFEYKRIPREAFGSFNLIVKHRKTGKCVRFKRERGTHRIKLSLRKCGDIFQMLLVLTRSGVTPLKPTFKEIAESRTVDMWSNQLFNCVFTSDPRSIFAWSKELPIVDGGLRLDGGNFHILRNRSLQIQNVTWNDRGKYFCNAMNSEGIATRRVELNVNAIQTFIVRPMNQETIVGQGVTFECRVEGIPKPRILWRVKLHNRDSFVRVDSLDQRRFRLMPNGTLVVLNVHFTDQGFYVCIAKSPGTKKNNATAYLTVYVPPRITLSSTKKSLFVGDSTRVTCHATGEPFPTIVWYKSPWVNMTDQRNLGLVDGNISFKEVSKQDAGVYVCMAQNRAGIAIERFQLDVTATCNFIHMRYSFVSPKKSFFFENEHVMIRCRKGFQLIGAGRLVCTSYGNWSHPFPRCLDIDECSSARTSYSTESSGLAESLDTEPDICHVNAICTNTIGSYRCACEEGYIGNGFTCTWRTTTTKAPTTTLTTTTAATTTPTTYRSLTKKDQPHTGLPRTEIPHENTITRTTAKLASTTTETPYEPLMLTVIFNFTKGYISEYGLLSRLLEHSHSIGELTTMEQKLKNLNVTLSALRAVLKPRNQRLVSRNTPWQNLKMFSNVVSSLLDSANTKIWKKRGETSNGASALLQIVDDYYRRYLNDLVGFSSVADGEIKTNNIVVKLKKFGDDDGENEVSIGVKMMSSYKSEMIFHKDSLPKRTSPVAVLVLYKNLDNVLKKSTVNSVQFVSKIVSLTVMGIQDGTALKKPVRLEFGKQMDRPSSPECVFWKFDKITGSGTWSNEGCRLQQNKSTQGSKSTIYCECDHLTTFAVIQRTPINGKSNGADYFVLTVSLSVLIGCGISIFFAFLTCISHLCFSSYVRSDRRIVMINTCACVLLGSVIFLGGAILSSFKLIKGDMSKYFCLAFSGSLQLFFLAFFCWMLVEAVQIYFSTRTVIDKGSGKLAMFYLFGWGLPALLVGLSLMLIFFNKIQITSWCWIDLSSYSHFLLTGIPVFGLFIITVILYAFISTSLRRNKDLLNPFVQKYTRYALWCSPILLVLHVMTILAVSAFLSFNNNFISHYILGALYGVEGIFLIVYQCYIEKVVLSKAGAMTPKRGKRNHSYSVKDTVTYGDDTCAEDGNGKYLIRRPSRRSLQDNAKGMKGSTRSDLDNDFDSKYFDMYGTSDRVISAKSPKRVPVLSEDDVDENGQLLNDDGTDDSNETASELRETQLTSFDISNGSELGSRRRGPSTCGSVISVETVNTSENIFKRKPSSNCGSIVSIEVKPRHQIQGIPVYFPGSAPPQHVLTLERKKKEVVVDSEEKYDNIDYDDNDLRSSHGSKGSTDPDRISNISNELTCILKELEAFSSDTATPSIPRKTGKAASANADTNIASSPVWQRRRPPYERQASVELTDIHSGTSQRYRTDWYGEITDSGDGLRKHPDNVYTSV